MIAYICETIVALELAVIVAAAGYIRHAGRKS